MADDIAQWLDGLGLGRYAGAFADNAIGFDILSRLSDDDLKELGLALGDRRRLQAAVAALGDGLGTPAGAPAEARRPDPPDAERRHITVLFCDLVGSTALASRLDPEDMRELLRGYQDACAGVIARYDGYVAKFMGDGVYAYFGYPAAHEDDAERAVSAGLGIVEAVSGLPHGLAVRVGIATGTVAVGDIVGEGASEEAAIVGEAPNMAARLQEIAAPGTVVIGEATHALAGGLFETADLGRREFRGFPEAMGAWSVSRARNAESRFVATRGGQLTELVGRDEELETLLRRWRRAAAGEGQIVLISGEPGIGKSRLVSALQDAIGDAPHLRLGYQCSPYHTNSALHPVIGHLERAARFEAGDGAAARLDKLEALVAQSGGEVAATAPLFAALLSIPAEDRYAPLQGTAQQKKARMLAALDGQLAGLAQRRPVLFVLEDAHWVDPTTLELLMLTAERVPERAVLMVVTYRPEFAAPWLGRPRVTPIILGRLESRDCERLIENVASRAELPSEARAQIAARSDGIPLFAEELTKTILESSGPANLAEVPATIQDSLEARLDRLGDAKELAQLASVFGREFGYRLLARASGLDDERLGRDLAALTGSELVSCRGMPPDALYTFRHALIQDTAYNSMLRGRRRELHGAVARVLEEAAGDGMATEAEVIGFHHAEAGNHWDAATCFLKAGERAYASWAMEEAVLHLNKALESLGNVPEDPESLELETDIYRLRGLTLKAVDGIGSEKARIDLKRSLEIGKRIGKTSDILPTLANMANTEAAQGRFDDAARNTDTIFELARARNDIPAEVAANFMQGIIRFHTGDTVGADANFRLCIELTKAPDFTMEARTWTFEPIHGARFRLSNALFVEGYPDQAEAMAEEAVSMSRQSTPLAIASALIYGCFTLIWRGDLRKTWDWAEETRRIVEQYVFAQHQGWSNVCMGWVRVLQGDRRQGLLQIGTGVEQFRDTGRKTWLAWFLMLRADAELHAGQPDKADATVVDAFAAIGEIGENQFLSPANSLKGDIVLALGQAEDAENCYTRALEIARAQSARSYELRAAHRLARCWQEQGKAGAARDLLAPVYGWFTEGFDTADLVAAKALLDELS